MCHDGGVNICKQGTPGNHGNKGKSIHRNTGNTGNKCKRDNYKISSSSKMYLGLCIKYMAFLSDFKRKRSLSINLTIDPKIKIFAFLRCYAV